MFSLLLGQTLKSALIQSDFISYNSCKKNCYHKGNKLKLNYEVREDYFGFVVTFSKPVRELTNRIWSHIYHRREWTCVLHCVVRCGRDQPLWFGICVVGRGRFCCFRFTEVTLALFQLKNTCPPSNRDLLLQENAEL